MEDRSEVERKNLVSMTGKNNMLSIRRQSELLEVNRSSLYYKPLGESAYNLELMNIIDKLNLENPTYGVLRMKEELIELGHHVNEKRVRRLFRKMGVEAIYPKRNLSKLGKAKYIQPYLLKGLKIDRPNQVWAIDISYIPMRRGFMYLTAIIDIYSRFIVGWTLSNTLEKQVQIDLVNNTIEKYGRPEIINSDQGSQFTSSLWLETLKKHNIKISMDGKGRAIDNIYIERFFRTIKQDYIYINPCDEGLELYQGVKAYIEKYNKRKHQGTSEKPVIKYKLVA